MFASYCEGVYRLAHPHQTHSYMGHSISNQHEKFSLFSDSEYPPTHTCSSTHTHRETPPPHTHTLPTATSDCSEMLASPFNAAIMFHPKIVWEVLAGNEGELQLEFHNKQVFETV